MADYKFDGKYLCCNRSHKRLAEVDGKFIKDDKLRRVGEVNGKYISDAALRRVAEFDGETIKDQALRRVASIGDVKRAIDGPGGITLVALWLFFVR